MDSDRIWNGCHVLAATTEEAITELPTSISGELDVVLKAKSTNSGDVRIGKTGLTNDSTPATAGYPLSPGEPIKVPMINPSALRLRGAIGDTVFFLALSS